jgi:predicted nuclease of predicted toxin-antitoxin system
MARFLVDEDLPRSTTSELVAAGHDAVDVRDCGLRGAPDEKVHERAIADARALVTGDLARIVHEGAR